MLQVGQMLLTNARNYPGRLAIVNGVRSLTYFELNRESNCVANGLKRYGVKKADRVALLLKNGIEWVVAWYACHKLGAVCVPLHARLRNDELAGILRAAKATTLIFGEDFLPQAMDLKGLYKNLKNLVCVDRRQVRDDGQIILWSEFQSMPDYTEAQVAVENKDPALLLFTSGTTGKPKGVLRSQEMVVLHAITLALRNNSPFEWDVMMSTAPLYHIGGLQGMIKMHVVGSTFITLNGIVPEEILKKIQEYRVTQLQMLPPVTYERVYRYDKWKDYDLSSVWEVCISAGKCTKEYTDHVFEMFPGCHLRPSWGSTESCSVTCMQLTKEELDQDPGLINAVGTVMPLTEIRIVDKNGEDVFPGDAGEAWVRSPMVFTGYLRNRRTTGEVLTEDGWFKTGDIMRQDPESGYYYFMDRKKDVIKTGGENVFALEIERVIQKHPDVQECAVVGVADLRFGEAIAAAIVVKPNHTLTAESLLAFCRKKLPSFKKPRYMALMDKLPVNSVGKVQKAVLRKKAEELFKPIV